MCYIIGVQVDLINLLDLRALQSTDGDDANSGDECETDEVSNVIETKKCIPETQSACRCKYSPVFVAERF